MTRQSGSSFAAFLTVFRDRTAAAALRMSGSRYRAASLQAGAESSSFGVFLSTLRAIEREKSARASEEIVVHSGRSVVKEFAPADQRAATEAEQTTVQVRSSETWRQVEQ